MNSSTKAVGALLEQAAESSRSQRFGEAGQLFFRAIELFDTWKDGPERSQQLGAIADLCARTGHPDLALMALQGLLESGKRLCDPAKHCADLLTLANS